MIPYTLLIVFPFIGCFICAQMKWNRKKINKNVLQIFFSLFCIILCSRGLAVGRDLVRYKFFFETCQEISFKQIFTTFSDEFGFYGLNWLIAQFTSEFQIVLVIIALLFTVIPLYQLYVRETLHPLLTISLFIGVCPFAMYFSGLSQVSAMAFAVPIYYCCRNKKFWLNLLFVIVATMFHMSGVVLLLIYPIYRVKLRRWHIFIIAIIIAYTFIFKEQLFRIALIFAGKYNMYGNIGNTNSYTMLALFVLFLIFTYMVVPTREEDDDYIGLRNLMIVIVIIQCFAPIHHLVMRLNYYYLPFLPVIMSKTIEKGKKDNSKMMFIASTVIVLFFTTYFLTAGINADNLEITPYISFWKR